MERFTSMLHRQMTPWLGHRTGTAILFIRGMFCPSGRCQTWRIPRLGKQCSHCRTFQRSSVYFFLRVDVWGIHVPIPASMLGLCECFWTLLHCVQLKV